VIALALSSQFCWARLWSDASGQHKIDAELVDCQKGVVKLRKPDGKVVDVPLSKLSAEDVGFIKEKMKPAIGTAKELEQQCAKQRSAVDAWKLCETFLAEPLVAQSEKDAAKPKTDVWKERSEKRLMRSGRSWVSASEAEQLKNDADRLITESFRLIEVGSGELAERKLEAASKKDCGKAFCRMRPSPRLVQL
jgi:SLA1 Homology Domain 1 (SHD1) protein